jgi:hypothetical protein
MSDTDKHPLTTAPQIVAHKCYCGDWAGFGFQPPRGNPEWWCWEHYPHKTPAQERNAAARRMSGNTSLR